IIDYFTNDETWFQANKKAVEEFPDVLFFPGFWSEVGMCGEPSAFGARCSFPKNQFPHAHKMIHSIEDLKNLQKPRPETDGFAPFILNRLVINRSRIEDLGHKIRFSVSRGPLNIAAYLMGTTEFLTSLLMYPEEMHKLLTYITDYLVEWNQLQRESIPTIDGIMILDDIIGFVGETEFKEFVLPYIKRIYECDVSVKFLHNDAECGPSLKYLPEIGVNIFNMGFNTSIHQLKEETHNEVVMLGNIPPRDVLAAGNNEEIRSAVHTLKKGLDSNSRVIFSCGGGMPPGVSTESIKTFCAAVNEDV
ncbi:MAG: uroporphyrinogen decarboxylase family protein, partial [Bacteroidales bacterium]